MRLVQLFVNTADVYSSQEDLPDAAALRTWLAERGLLSSDTKVTEPEYRRAIQVREALRNVLGGNSGFEVTDEARQTLNEAAQRAKLAVHFRPETTADLTPCASGVDAAIGRILSAAYSGMVNGTWERLKVCRDERCVWAFYDQSKNHSSRWCSMAVCGNRAKARRQRQKAKK